MRFQCNLGAFANVYEGVVLKIRSDQIKSRKVSVGDKIAIKIIDKKRLKEQRSLTDRVRNEVYIQQALNHPHILELFDFMEDNVNVYLIMEYCERGELWSFMKRTLKRPLLEHEANKIFLQIVQGVAYLHSNGIIHRDLKCSNVLLTKDMVVVRPISPI
jgi:serine/threonine protein kinase